MYATLMQLRRPTAAATARETSTRRLHDAVQKVSWSTDQSAYKVVFLVGDAPPHMDYQDDVKYPEIVAAATAKGIVVNTIQCGLMGDRRSLAAHRVARPRPILHGRSGRQRPRDRDAVRCADRDARRRARRDAAVLRLCRGARAHERKVAATDELHEELSRRAGPPRRVQRDGQRHCEPRRRQGARARRHERTRRSRRRASGRAAAAARRLPREEQEKVSRKAAKRVKSCSSRSASSRASAMRSSRASSRSSAARRTRSTGRSIDARARAGGVDRRDLRERPEVLKRCSVRTAACGAPNSSGRRSSFTAGRCAAVSTRPVSTAACSAAGRTGLGHTARSWSADA